VRSGELDPRVGAAVGGLTALLVAVALVPVREDLSSTGLALLFVLPVVLGAITGGRIGGVLTAAVAALAFDFFLTRPYLSLAIHSADDVVTAIVLLAVGLVVGTVAAGGRRASYKADTGRSELDEIHRVAELVSDGVPTRQVVDAARSALMRVLQLDHCEFDEQRCTPSLPRLEHSGTFDGVQFRYVHGGFVLPSGVQLAVRRGGRHVGRFVLHGRQDTAVSLNARIAAVVIADEVGASFATDGGTKEREEQA
jgi:hypothetical protein